MLKTVTSSCECLFRTNGSRFLGYIFPIHSVESFDEQLASVRLNHPAATHHCYAWRINPRVPTEFSQDDGEPSGTAGRPILNELKSNDLVNTGLIVVRYFGGTKLGKPGLIEAYGFTAKSCIDQAKLATVIPTSVFKIRYAYEFQNLYEKWKNRYDFIEKETRYREDVMIIFACPDAYTDRLRKELEECRHILSEYSLLEPSFEVKLF